MNNNQDEFLVGSELPKISEDTNDVINVPGTPAGYSPGDDKHKNTNEEAGQDQPVEEESDDAETIEYGHSESEVDDIFREENAVFSGDSNPSDGGISGEINGTVVFVDDHSLTQDAFKPFDYSDNSALPQFMKIHTGMCTRAKERKLYTDEDLDDDEIEGKRNYNLEERIKSNKYNKNFVKELKGHEFNLKYLQENGLENPLIFYDKTGLGMRVPSENFQVSDVKQCVGSRRVLDVMDVNTQKGMDMSMKDWVKYFENKERDRLLNVISLEFSHTRLENYVESPTLVRQVDWVDTVWPPHYKEGQTESTNIIEKMMYPKVQKYCLMSVAGCYTDFHIDFGGTSVWYHILHGKKIFWMIPPTEKNIEAYENWILSAEQGNIFLADQIKDCQKVVLKAGTTFIIPSGWIHAVYTPMDSLVFGGNFIHSFNIVQQLRVSEVEERTHVPHKFRYPFYNEISWYVLARYLNCITGKNYLEKHVEEDEEEISPLSTKLSKVVTVELTRVDEEKKNESQKSRKSSTESSASDSSKLEKKKSTKETLTKPKKHVYLTPYELAGLERLVEHLEELPENKKGVPKDMKDSQKVLSDMKKMLKDHKDDDSTLAATGEPILVWPPSPKKMKPKVKNYGQMSYSAHGSKSKTSHKGSSASSIRRRRTRCKKCEPCTRSDCGECHFCKDMKKFGGPGRMKQCCISKQCMAPVLPNTAVCMICGKDDRVKSEDSDEMVTTLMECGICWKIVHHICLSKKYENLDNDGVVNEDLPNQWECPKCCNSGKQGQIKIKIESGDKTETVIKQDDIDDEKDSREDVKEGIALSDHAYTSPPHTPAADVKKRKTTSLVKSPSPVKKVKLLKSSALKNITKSDTPKTTRSGRTLKILTPADGTDDVPSNPLKKRSLTNNNDDTTADMANGSESEDHDHNLTDSDRKRPRREVQTTPERRSRARGRGQKYRSRYELGHCQRSTSRNREPILESFAVATSSVGYHSSLEFIAGQEEQLTVIGGKNVLPHDSSSHSQNGTICDQTSVTRDYHKQLEGRQCRVVLERHPVRPAPIEPPPNCVLIENDKEHCLKRLLWMRIFSFLSQDDLCQCLCVNRTWNRWCIDRSLWKVIDLSVTTIKKQHLCGIVRRQPASLILSSVVMSQKQLTWLLARLPQLKELNLSHSSWATISALCSSSCPLFHSLDLCWATGLNEQCFIDILTPPVAGMPGMDNKSRLSGLQNLLLAGTEITDASLEFLTQHVTGLHILDLSFCVKLTDKAIEILVKSETVKNCLRSLNISGCKQLTDKCLGYLKECVFLEMLNVERCPKINADSRKKFAGLSIKSVLW